MTYSSTKAKCKKFEEDAMQKRLEILEKELNLINDTANRGEFFELKQKWKNSQTVKTKGIIMSSKAKFAEEGEKSQSISSTYRRAIIITNI